MKRRFTILTAALVLLEFLALPMGMRGQTTVASFVRNGNSNTTTGGVFTTTFSAKSGYYQDANGDCYMQILNTDAYWTTTPTSISFTALIGGGSGNTDLTDPVYVALLDASGDVISGTQTTVTSHITTNTGDNYTISIPATNNVYGVKLSHNKQTGFNVRYYSFSLSYVSDGGTPSPTTYTVTFNAGDGTFVGSEDFPDEENEVEAGEYTLPSATPAEGYTFNGWALGENTYVGGARYTVNGDADFVASYTENTTPTPGGGTATLNIEAYADANNWENGVKYTEAIVTPITFTANGGGNTGKYYTSGEEWRYYQGESASITISVPEGYTLVSVTPTYNVNNGGVLKNGNTNITSGTTVDVSGTSVTFTVGNSGSATNGQVRFTNIDVTYVSDGGTIPPSITANSFEIGYNVTSGSIAYTINNEPDPVGTLTAAVTEGNWLTLSQGTTSPIAFTCTANENTTARTATVTLTYTYDTDQTVTANVTVTQAAAPVSYTTIPDLFAAATGTETPVYVTFNNWVVSGVSTNGKNVFVTDNNGNGFVIFDNNGGLGNTYTVGDILAGTAVSCNLKKYNGFAELLNVNANALTITTGGTVTVANVAMADLTGVNTGALLHYEGLTCEIAGNKTNLSDDNTTIQVYNALYAFNALEDGETYNITGIYQQYNNTKEILPRSAEDIEKIVNTTLDITGYEAGSTGGYYLIASPVTVNPANVEGMTTGEYDLYYFNQAEDDEWRNYKQNAFNLEPGKGYLYAKQATTENEIFHFELTGTPYDNQPITLSKTEDVDFPGWNLVGNPFGQTAYIDRDFYVMNDDGTEIITGEGNEIGVMQGVFVIATEDGEEMTFSTEAPGTTGEKLVMNVSRNRGNVVDRAIVRFGQGGVLPKFQLNENSTKLYIVEGENEYAVVRSANEGEMPVNFKASENGNYTLSVNTENMEMEYLHLIDNMTGADIDLLATPSYSFEARTNDYESRFRLVFSGNTNVGSSTSSETFAFFNGNSWVINNEGEATLQVIDMMGRVLSNEQINGNYNNSLNLSAGVYVLRLSNGNTVKTQKVVVD